MSRVALSRAHGALLRAARTSRPAVSAPVFYPTRRFFAAETKPPPPEDKSGREDFQSGLAMSIMGRLQRERESLSKYAAEREKATKTEWWAATVLVISASAFCYWMGLSYPREPSADSTLPLSETRPPPHDVRPQTLQAAWADLVAIVGESNVSTLDSDREHHANSSWSSHKGRPDQKPFMVVYPKTTEEVSAIMKVCHHRRIPVTAFSGGTSLEGHFTPTRGGLCVDFGHMNKIVALHAEDLDVVVQPGLNWESLNDQLASSNLFFPPDPGPGAMIGGMVGTGCSGTNAYRYGTMREWVLSLTVVLADGTVIKTRQRPRKSSAGYDLTRLFIGGEGTLGLVTEATLKLAVRPASTSVAVASFGSVRQAASCVSRIVAAGIPVAAVEILDDMQMHAINLAGSTSRVWQERPTLFFKFAGTKGAVKEQVTLVKDLAKQTGCTGFEFARNEDEQHELWSARKEALWSVMAAGKDDDRVWTGDVAVPISKLPDIIELTKKDVTDSGFFGTIVGHVGDGNFHLILLYNEAQRAKAEDLVHTMVKRAVEMEGTVTGEHGVGLVKRDYLPHELGETTVDTMRKIKQALDPLGLLNIDKVIRMEKPKKGEVGEW